MIENFKQKANEDYKIIKEVLDNYGVKFFATGGTCLGAVRDGDFIEWDNDIDLGTIWHRSFESKWEISEALRKEGFRACYESFETDGRHMIFRNILTGLHWLMRSGDDYIFRWPNLKIAMKTPAKYMPGFKEVKLGDSTILVFDPPEPYLIKKFGEDWREPKQAGHSNPIIND